MRCIGFINERTGEEYVMFTDATEEEMEAEDAVEAGCKLFYDKEVGEVAMPSGFPLERTLKVE